jgi:hypothetical protein
MGSNKGDQPGHPVRVCLEREIGIYGQTLETLATLRRGAPPLKVAVFSVDRDWATRLAALLTPLAKVYHVNGQRDFLLPDVVIAQSFSEQLLRAARLAELYDCDVAADMTEIEAVRQTARQLLGHFKYGIRR